MDLNEEWELWLLMHDLLYYLSVWRLMNLEL